MPPPALEIGRETNTVRLVLYGEPYAHYTLQDSTNLTFWDSTSFTNLHDEQIIAPPASGPRDFYRTTLPVP